MLCVHFVGAEQKQLSIAIARLDQESLHMFLEDPTVFDHYVDEVPCPMYLNLITTRLEAGYYRTVAHIRHDIGLLLHNYKLFNVGEDSDWVEEIQEMLLECVESKLHCRAPSSMPAWLCVNRVSAFSVRAGCICRCDWR